MNGHEITLGKEETTWLKKVSLNLKKQERKALALHLWGIPIAE